jgi:hypothetical protein
MDRGLVDSCVRSAIRQAEGTVALAPRQKEYIKMKTLYKNIDKKICVVCGSEIIGKRNMVCSDQCYDDLCEQEAERLSGRNSIADMEYDYNYENSL